MSKGIVLGVILAMSVVLGSLSMGCITTPDVPEETYGLTERGLQVKADVAERQARGFVQYTGTTATDFYDGLGYDVNLYKSSPPVISYCRCFASIPENVAGFDTPMERAYIYQAELNAKVASMDISKQYSQSGGSIAYKEFYLNYYEGLQDKYEKMYCGVGNKVIGD